MVYLFAFVGGIFAIAVSFLMAVVFRKKDFRKYVPFFILQFIIGSFGGIIIYLAFYLRMQ
jgi:hypothetical protein